jgi:hypothetical protein
LKKRLFSGNDKAYTIWKLQKRILKWKFTIEEEPPFELCDKNDAEVGLAKSRKIIKIILEKLK